MGTNLVMAVAAAVLVGVTACGDDADAGQRSEQEPTSTTAFDPRVGDDETDDRLWHGGSAALDLEGDQWEFDLDFCAVQPVDPDTDTVTLQVDGETLTDEGAVTLAVVETVTHEYPSRIQVVSVRFEDGGGRLLRTWEAQRVIDIGSGAVDDMHADGTTPLLVVEESDALVVTVSDAAFWQFDMGGGEGEGVVGTGRLRAECTPD